MSKHDTETLGTNYANSGLRYFNDFHAAHRRRPTTHRPAAETFTVLDLLGVVVDEARDTIEHSRLTALHTGLMDAQFQAARNRHPAGKGLIAA